MDLHVPFKTGSINIVWNGGVVHHFSGLEKQVIFDEAVRVLRINGQIIIIIPNALNLPYRLKKLLETLGLWIYGEEIPFSIFELKQKLKNAGALMNCSAGCEVLTPYLSLFLLKRILIANT